MVLLSLSVLILKCMFGNIKFTSGNIKEFQWLYYSQSVVILMIIRVNINVYLWEY